MSTVRVRFAPSPTGNLHMGSARTALFNWLYAKAQSGTFILRIEDTDKNRSSEVYLEEILSSLKWLGMTWDEGPYFQSGRRDLYLSYAEKFLEKGMAYKDGDAVIFKVPAEKVKFNDIVHGDIEVDNTLVGELVLIKSDKTPAYNFACVVDDIDMKVSHVIRGDDHISNTNKQIALYKALEVRPPKFAHIPLILAPDKSRLSKRFGATSISEYREKGYLPEAMVNYLSLLGWAPGDDREFMEVEHIIKKFTLKRINKRGAEFNEDKLRWLNGEHIRKLDLGKFIEIAAPFVKGEYEAGWFKKFAALYHPRVKTLVEFKQELDIFTSEEVPYDKETVQKFLKNDDVLGILKLAKERLERIKDFTPANIETEARTLIKESDLKGGDLIHPLRVAVTGKSVSAGIFDVLALLGKEKTLKRLRRVIEEWKRRENL
ncbi:MAG: glutamate--tRNA ligase [Candidatus Omnitrophica bacterium]|nr:glutamate--tRNA ligase [Candidatus Omnitrophota bacterium]